MKSKIICITAALSFIISAAAYNFLPEQIPVHYDISGNVDRYGSRNEIFFYPCLILVLTVSYFIVMKLLEKSISKANSEKDAEMKKNNSKVISTVFLCMIFIQFGMHCISVFSKIVQYRGLYGFDEKTSFDIQMSMLTLMLGIMYIVLGNIMSKTKRNGAVGFRTNSSMKNDYTWQQSNRFAGRAMMMTGVISLVLAFVLKGISSIFFMLGCLIICVIVSSIYSYKIAEGQNKSE